MTPSPRCLDTSDTVADAAQMMREEDIGDVFVCAEGRLTGIVTDRDLVVRALAGGTGDPGQVKLGEIASTALTALAPDDSVEDAIAVMRELAIRRIPVCEDARPLGVVTIGDLAIERDASSPLANISAAPANT